jgi:hypothetical protein
LFVGSSRFQEAKQAIEDAISRYNASLLDLGVGILLDTTKMGAKTDEGTAKLTGKIDGIVSQMNALNLCIFFLY